MDNQEPIKQDRQEFEKWLKQVADNNPAGISDEFIYAAKAGWQARSVEIEELRRTLTNIKQWAKMHAPSVKVAGAIPPWPNWRRKR